MTDYAELVKWLRETANGDQRCLRSAAAIEALVKERGEIVRRYADENARLRGVLQQITDWPIDYEGPHPVEVVNYTIARNRGIAAAIRDALGEGKE